MKNNNEEGTVIINAFIKDPVNDDLFKEFKMEKIEK